MSRYTVLIDGETGAYGVAVPDCPGCTAMGATIDEAMANATAALSEWMGDRVAAGLAPPIPRPPDALRADPSLAEALSEATPGLVPLLLDSGRPVRVNVSLDAAAWPRSIPRPRHAASPGRPFWSPRRGTRSRPRDEPSLFRASSRGSRPRGYPGLDGAVHGVGARKSSCRLNPNPVIPGPRSGARDP